MSKKVPEVDCTRSCKSKQHGTQIVNAITKRSVSNEALASYFYSTCSNFNKVVDEEGGRTALHMAASCGRASLANWLARTSPPSVLNKKDLESGFTALHRAVFYGQIDAAVALLKQGIKKDTVDKDDYTALDHSMLDNVYIRGHIVKAPLDVYTWGTNTNYTLGNMRPGSYPNLLNWRPNTTVSKVYLGKFHSIWLTESGDVYACGQTGRLGVPYAPTIITPTLVKLAEPCQMAAVSIDSSVFLTESGSVYQYTLKESSTASSATNTKNATVLKLPQTKAILKLSQPKGLCSSRNHFAVWTEFVVYTWGINVGQLGHSNEEKIVVLPKKVSAIVQNSVSLVSASEAATLIYTQRGDLYLLHNHICKKIVSKLLHVTKICVEAKVSETGSLSRVTALLLNGNHEMMIWQDTIDKLTLCSLGVNHQVIVRDFCLTHDNIYFTTKLGSAYVGYISRKEAKKATPKITNAKEHNQKNKEVKETEKTSVRIERMPNIHRATSILCDAEGLNFVCLQYKPSYGLTSLPYLTPSNMPEDMNELLETACEEDLLHDVVFKVGPHSFPAHIFLFASQSELIYEMYKEAKDKTAVGDKPILNLANVHPLAFERIMRYLYTGTCDVTQPGRCELKLLKSDLIGGNNDGQGDKISEPIVIAASDPSDISAFESYKEEKPKKGQKSRNNKSSESVIRHQYCDPVKLVQAAAKRLQFMGMHKVLDRFIYHDGYIRLKERASPMESSISFDITLTPDLADTILKSKDDVLTPAHKCILAARLEYFNGMFMHTWHESKENTVINLPYKQSILLPIIEFLYTDRCAEVENSDSIEFLTNMMIVTDQLFVTRLREICEVSLANLLNLKNCAELCQFAHTYNAEQLKKCCMEFICLNITTLLENSSLEPLNSQLLTDIKDYYREFNPIMSSRVITPFYNAVDDDTIMKSAEQHPISFDRIDEDLKVEDSFEDKRKRNSKTPKRGEHTKSEKERMRYESVNSNTDAQEIKDITLSLQKLPINESPKSSDWVKISHGKPQTKVQARLKAITRAKDIANEDFVEQSTVLVKSVAPVSPKTTEISDQIVRNNFGSISITHVGPKLSQKQRKKLASEGHSSLTSLDNHLSNGNEPVSSPPTKNPWKVIETPPGAIPRKLDLGFNSILADQRKQKDDQSRITSKPLSLTQLEDKAIEELERFYNVEEADEEYITVRRVEIKLSSPQWINVANKHM